MPILSPLINIFAPTPPEIIKSIVLARTDKIGDLILTIPSILMMRKLYPDATITLLVNKYNFGVVRYLDIVDEIIKIDEHKENDLIDILRQKEIDVFISFFTDNFIGRLAFLSHAKLRIAPLSKLHSYYRYNMSVYQKRSHSIKNEAEYNLDLVRKIDLKKFEQLFDIEQKIKYSDANKKHIDKFLNDNKIKKDFIIVNVFGGGSCKNLSISNYKDIIDIIKPLLKKVRIILIATKEESKFLDIFDDDKNIVKYINNDDILNVAALIDRSSLYIGTSTGTTHISGNLRKKSVAIYPAKKTQSHTRWGLYGNDVNTLYIVPDQNHDDDYTHKYFDQIDDTKISIFAREIIEFYYAN